KRIVAAVTSLGVKKIYLINSWRVEKSFWDSQFMDEEKLAHYMVLGLEQARDTLMPNLHIRRYFTAFVKEELPGIARDHMKILAHPKTDQVCPVAVNQPAVLVIGPEGGFIDLEVETLAQAGFSPFSIGPRILKVETAVTHLISRLYG
ncbi:MAG: RsmE family RNA methyltransferase, partial [Desulfobacterales bacterium]|nr:RsmE family RNA methyltransferase [Desulfobacterales bacterium]